MQTDTDNTISPAPEKPFEHWVRAAYGRSGNLTYKYKNLVFTPEGEARVMMIAGWITGLIHAGQFELATAVAADINSNLEYLNGYGGDVTDTFEEGAPVKGVPRYVVQLSDDGTFGGFNVAWYRAMEESLVSDDNEKGLLSDRWGGRHTISRWNPNPFPVRESKRYVYRFDFSGGLLYHGPGGGEVFSVNVGSSRFWGIHT